MQVKTAVISMASIAAVFSTSAFSIGLGVQIGAGLDAGLQTGTRSVASPTAQVPAQVQLRAPVPYSAAASADTQIKTDSHVTERKRSGDVVHSVVRAEANMSPETARAISATGADKTAAAQTTKTGAKAKANLETAVKSYGVAPLNNNVGADASLKAGVSGS